jgi:outer membrane lipoprotein LolB
MTNFCQICESGCWRDSPMSDWLWRAVWPVLLVVAGCAVQPPASEAPEAVWLEHQANIEQLTSWQVQGRLALRVRNEGWTAGFDWQQKEQAWHIRLSGPFGQGVVELHGDTRGVWLQQAGRAPVFATDPESLLEQETGWRLPVSGLAWWLRGIPAAGKTGDFQWDAQGRLAYLQQGGWQVDYRRYLQVGDYPLPDRLQMKRDSMHVKFVLDGWQLQ